VATPLLLGRMWHAKTARYLVMLLVSVQKGAHAASYM
jgi:hypothetical protein